MQQHILYCHSWSPVAEELCTLPGEARPHARAGRELKLNIQSGHGVKPSLGLCANSARGTHPALNKPPAATRSPSPGSSKAGEVTGGDHVWSQSYLEATTCFLSHSLKQENKGFLPRMAARSSYGATSVWMGGSEPAGPFPKSRAHTLPHTLTSPLHPAPALG